MVTLAAIPYTYTTQGTVIPVTVLASNSFGDSTISTANSVGAEYLTVPGIMIIPTRGSSSTES
jgi:hypothetical protein